MSDDAMTVANQLVYILERENESLRCLDYQTAVALGSEKEALIAVLSKAASQLLSATNTTALSVLRQHLNCLAAENQGLLERAIEIQTRVVRIVARAATPSLTDVSYTINGCRSRPNRVAAMALSANI